MLENGTRVNIEVQVKNEGNIDRRSLFYWSKEYNSGIKAGQNYEELNNVIAINIVNFEFLPCEEFHTIFHLRDDKNHKLILTDALEIYLSLSQNSVSFGTGSAISKANALQNCVFIRHLCRGCFPKTEVLGKPHFIEMAKFRKIKEKDIENDALQRWLVALDERSPLELVEEAACMDAAIKKIEDIMAFVTQDEDAYRAYELKQKAEMDWNSSMSYARKQGLAEGLEKGSYERNVIIAKNALSEGASIDFVKKITGLNMETIIKLGSQTEK